MIDYLYYKKLLYLGQTIAKGLVRIQFISNYSIILVTHLLMLQIEIPSMVYLSLRVNVLRIKSFGNTVIVSIDDHQYLLILGDIRRTLKQFEDRC